MAKAREVGEAAAEKVGEEEKAWVTEAKRVRVDPKQKRTVKKGPYLSKEASRKLAIAALVEKMDEGLVLEGLIRTNLSGYKAYGPARKGTGDDEEEPEEGE